MTNTTPTEPALDPELEKRIKSLCAKGYDRYDQGDYRAAVRVFYQAWLVLPKPQQQYVQAGWVLTALADGYLRAGKPVQALQAAQSALCCPGANKNYVARLRMGQALLDLGDTSAARINLFKVYSLQGEAAFASEPVHYLNAIADLTEA